MWCGSKAAFPASMPALVAKPRAKSRPGLGAASMPHQLCQSFCTRKCPSLELSSRSAVHFIYSHAGAKVEHISLQYQAMRPARQGQAVA